MIGAVGWQLGAVLLVALVLVAVMTAREEDPARSREASSGSSPAPSHEDPATLEPHPPGTSAAATGTPDPLAKPPYTTVPQFSSASARDAAFVGDVALLSSWSSLVSPYNVMSSNPSVGVKAFRTAVVKDARSVCTALASGTTMNDLPSAVELNLDDPVDQAAFIVEAVAFYCPDRTAETTGGVYSKPVPVKQNEDCPTDSTLKITAMITGRTDNEYTHEATYKVSVHNTSRYQVRAELEQLWLADGYQGEWEPFGESLSEAVVTIDAGETFDYEGDVSGIYHWKRVSVQVEPGAFVFPGCGYQPGPTGG
ncbi:DUF732 domain-containing protein [Streptomyces sp. KHY 26]|uniref:DUF732 domain-containing protein n=1 Tax=Streptomyces sp. KHY 26 TaxID=3097359 RepID=UPI00376F127A